VFGTISKLTNVKIALKLFQFLTVACIVSWFISCQSIKNSTYYQESKFPNHLDSIQLNFLNDSIIEIQSKEDSQTFRFYKLGKHYYKIKANNNTLNSSFSYLTTDTMVLHGHRLYYYSNEVKLVFNSKRK
jgi:hypothetical protein